MKHIRLRIIDLIDQHGNSFDKCPGCAACTEIERMRKSLDREPEDKFKHILDKGQDMTKSDIAFLLENEVGKISIKKALKMDSTGFLKMMTNLGFTKRRQQKEEVKVGKLEMTAEEFVDLKYKQNLSFVQIAKLKGVSEPTVRTWKNKHADEIEKALLALNLPQDEEKKTKTANPSPEVKKALKSEIKASEPKPIGKAINEALNEAFAEKTAEYERLIAALRNDLNEAHKQLDEKDEKIRDLEHLHAAFDDTEKELSAVETEKEDLQSKYESTLIVNERLNEHAKNLVLQIKPLEEENQALRTLVKLWM